MPTMTEEWQILKDAKEDNMQGICKVFSAMLWTTRGLRNVPLNEIQKFGIPKSSNLKSNECSKQNHLMNEAIQWQNGPKAK